MLPQKRSRDEEQQAETIAAGWLSISRALIPNNVVTVIRFVRVYNRLVADRMHLVARQLEERVVGKEKPARSQHLLYVCNSETLFENIIVNQNVRGDQQ